MYGFQIFIPENLVVNGKKELVSFGNWNKKVLIPVFIPEKMGNKTKASSLYQNIGIKELQNDFLFHLSC